MDGLVEELSEWLRIPSVSTGGGQPIDLWRAADWAASRVRDAGGSVDLVSIRDSNPLVIGELKSTRPNAPTVLVYGHYDVQDAGDASAWTSPPFTPEIREGRVYARGAADDKGNFLPLMHVACGMARDGVLPVNVRFLIEGEEEISGQAAQEWLRADRGAIDAAVVFDTAMEDAVTPAITVGLRGLVQLHLTVRTAAHDLHQGLFGGVALNATHVLLCLLSEVLPDAQGRVRPELTVGATGPTEAERLSWRGLDGGDSMLTAAGARPLSASAASEWRERIAAPALDVDHLEAGARRTIIPAEAHATIALRLAPGQSVSACRTVLEELLRASLPKGAELEVDGHDAAPVFFDPDLPALRLAGQAMRSACGRDPVFTRVGGSIAMVGAMSAVGIPTLVSGFSLPEDAIHAPDESFSLRSLSLGEATARELFTAFAALPRRNASRTPLR